MEVQNVQVTATTLVKGEVCFVRVLPSRDVDSERRVARDRGLAVGGRSLKVVTVDGAAAQSRDGLRRAAVDADCQCVLCWTSESGQSRSSSISQ